MTPLVIKEAASPDAKVPLNKNTLRDLRGIGHKLERFLTARGKWWRQAQRTGGAANERWKPLFGQRAPSELPHEGVFASFLTVEAPKILLDTAILPKGDTEALLEVWNQIDPGAPKDLLPVLEQDPDSNNPHWLALLRLSPLREFWDRELRRATVDALHELLPDAWVMDPAVLPPGAVIPRLDIASWTELPRRRSCGSSYAIHSIGQAAAPTPLTPRQTVEDWVEASHHALSQFAESPRVLVELSPAVQERKGTAVVAFYEKKGGRTEGIGAIALTFDPEGSLVPARLAAA